MARCLKNPHYKSTSQTYNTNTQSLLATNTVSNPLVLTLLGSETCDTGCSIIAEPSQFNIESTGTYEIGADVNITDGVAGAITVAITLNGVILPESVRTVSFAAGIDKIIPTNIIKYILSGCTEDGTLRVVAYSDGTATADITNVSVNVKKLA